MFDLTPHITLPAKNTRLYFVARIVLYTLFVCAVCVLLYKIIFPSAYFSFDLTKPNALANTIARPYTSQNLIHFTTVTSGAVDSATITLTFDKKPKSSPITVSLKKGYFAGLMNRVESDYRFFKPKKFSQNQPPRSGTLFEHRNGVWIVDDKTIRPIADINTFITKGWSFDDVQKIDNSLLINYKKGRLFTLKDAHPNGTVFYERDTDTYYVTDKNTLRAITQKMLAEHYPHHTRISLESTNRTQSDTCTLRKSRLPWQKTTYLCTVDFVKIRSLIGTEYIFSIPIDTHSLSTLSIALNREVTYGNAIATLQLLKQRFFQRYAKN